MPIRRTVSAIRIALLYAAFGAAWFVLFALLLPLWTPFPRRAHAAAMLVEGAGFILLSAAFIHFLVRRETRGRHHLRAFLGELLELMPGIMVLRRLEDDVVVEASEEFAESIGVARREIVGARFASLGLKFDREERRRYEAELERERQVRNLPLSFRRPDGREGVVLLSSRVVTLEGRDYNLSTAKDVTELRAARAEAEEGLRQLRALRKIDRAITGSIDLRVTLDVILDQVLEGLKVDAAVILVTNAQAARLEFAAARGFRTQALRHTDLELGHGYAGQAARRRTVVRVADLSQAPYDFVHSRQLDREGFVSYVASPLVAKGTVVGVLEVFHREPFEPDPVWLDFLEAVAAQAAVAIDNATLFDGLQETHLDLQEAYDKTIEGWSRALDLRDRITSGHTHRVSELTVRLARRLGMGGAEIAQVRRGALLHDIGKMGIPDSILHKTGPLDEMEWKVMRQHPILAHKLLAPIEFLKPALDIPYCHHEKWDGTGYPRGLEGEEIPLSARIFAVVDVWDALRSDRPYRKAWPPEKVLAHIEEQAGSHFDPCVVEAFLELMREMEAEGGDESLL